ncbi:MAG: dienelactone hydrolase family protein [Fimbriimonas sp.]
MRLLSAILVFCLCVFGTAQDWAKARLEKSPRHQEWVEVTNGTRKVKAFVVYPEVKGKAPVVILIHEIFGMSDWIKSVADDLAAEGYIAIAPDLLSGMGPGGGRTDSFEASKITEAVSSLPPDQVTGDLNAVADYALTIPAGNRKISVAGFCWGGTQSFRFATNRKDLSVACVFYGSGPDDEEALKRINTPVLGFYGGNDARIGATVPKTVEAMAKLGKHYEAITYTGAGHGFMRAGQMPDAGEENKAARDKAWTKWLSVLARLR